MAYINGKEILFSAKINIGNNTKPTTTYDEKTEVLTITLATTYEETTQALNII